jgi:hypothetical protein
MERELVRVATQLRNLKLYALQQRAVVRESSTPECVVHPGPA